MCAFGKSSPTTPTRLTGEKKLAPTAAYDAEPPSRSACSSTGVLTVSSAMEPTIRTDIGFPCRKRPRQDKNYPARGRFSGQASARVGCRELRPRLLPPRVHRDRELIAPQAGRHTS